MQIRFFVDDHILSSIFYGDADKSKEQKFRDTIKHAMTVSGGPHILETLMECTAEIMVAVNIDSKVFLSSLIPLVDQLDSHTYDSENKCIQGHEQILLFPFLKEILN